MSIPSSAASVLVDMNSLVALIIAERDRLTTLSKASLPGGNSLWNVIPEEVRTTVSNDAQTNLDAAATLLGNIQMGIYSS